MTLARYAAKTVSEPFFRPWRAEVLRALRVVPVEQIA
jgi:hypothetical protein